MGCSRVLARPHDPKIVSTYYISVLLHMLNHCFTDQAFLLTISTDPVQIGRKASISMKFKESRTIKQGAADTGREAVQGRTLSAAAVAPDGVRAAGCSHGGGVSG